MAVLEVLLAAALLVTATVFGIRKPLVLILPSRRVHLLEQPEELLPK